MYSTVVIIGTCNDITYCTTVDNVVSIPSITNVINIWYTDTVIIITVPTQWSQYRYSTVIHYWSNDKYTYIATTHNYTYVFNNIMYGAGTHITHHTQHIHIIWSSYIIYYILYITHKYLWRGEREGTHTQTHNTQRNACSQRV